MTTRVPVLLLLALATSFGCAGLSGNSESERRIAELERENAAPRDQVDTAEARLQAVLQQSGTRIFSCSWPPRMDAVVLDVNRDLKLVVMNKGKSDGVKVGYVFDVYLRSTYKGQVRVQDVQEATSSGRIVYEMNPIARGDAATTSL